MDDRIGHRTASALSPFSCCLHRHLIDSVVTALACVVEEVEEIPTAEGRMKITPKIKSNS